VSDLTAIEKRKLERAFGMGGGYVLNFSNRTFAEFFLDSFGIDIYDAKYDYGSGSKANRMRAFWDHENNYLVGKVLGLLFEEWSEFKGFGSPDTPPEDCLKIVRRLQESAPVPDIDAVSPNVEDESFETLARSVRESIDKNEPEIGLDRLHTFLIKYFRVLCAKRGIATDREKPLHSLVGEYVKKLKAEALIESEMTERILKGTISVMEAFNRVRNDQSFAHDNPVLNYNESLLIFGHVTSSIRFIEAIEKGAVKNTKTIQREDDELPF
jgi:Abortive infection C-terminus